MSSLGTLYGGAEHPLVKRILAAAAIAGVSFDLAKDYDSETTRTSLPFKAKFPGGKIPALEGPDGFLLTETSAIMKYVALRAPNANLLGSDAQEHALVEQWLSFVRDEVRAHSFSIQTLLKGTGPYNKPAYTAAFEKLTRGLTLADRHLANHTFLVTQRITLADISLAASLQNIFAFVGADVRAKFINATRFAETVLQHPKLASIWGPLQFAETTTEYLPPKKEKAPKVEKPKAEPKPKAEKKPKEPEPEDDDGDIDLVPREEPKEKNPLDLLPKSNFNLEDWKRAYSNMDTRGAGGSIEWFYQKFDPEGFSLWRVDFKYNEELTQTFMSSNQIGGFFNRLEASRKYLFGSVGVLGETNNSVISGVLIARGPDIKPVIDVAPDWESYAYQPIDLKDEAQKQFFEAALAWDLDIDGKKWVDGKNFK